MSPADLEREAMDYEENARYDQFDGLRGDYYTGDGPDYRDDLDSADNADFDKRVDYYSLGYDDGYHGSRNCAGDWTDLTSSQEDSYCEGYAIGRDRRKSDDLNIPF